MHQPVVNLQRPDKVLRYVVTLLKYCIPWSETIVNMLHIAKNKLLECLFESHQLILVRLNLSQEPETGNRSPWLLSHTGSRGSWVVS